MNKFRALLELLVRLNKRRLRNPVGSFLFYRLHQDRELQLFWPGNALAPRNDHEIRHVNTVVMENFLRNALVFAKNQAGGAATSKGHVLHLQERNNILVESAVVLKLIRQIKNYIRLEGFQF